MNDNCSVADFKEHEAVKRVESIELRYILLKCAILFMNYTNLNSDLSKLLPNSNHLQRCPCLTN